MSDNRDTFVSEIYVNNEQARDAIAELTSEVNRTSKAYEKLLNQKNADPAKTEKARKAWESATQSLANARKGTEAYATAIKELSGKSMQNLLRMQRQIKSELDKTKPDTEEWKQLAKAYQDVTNRMKTLSDAQRGVTTGTGKLTNGMGGLLGKLGNVSSMITAVPTLLKGVRVGIKAITTVTRETIKASQTMADKWNNGMAAMKTTTDAFFFSLSTGDWSAFENGLLSVLKKARQLAETMDQLGSYNIAEGYMQSKYLTDYQTNITTATDTEATATAAERRDALAAAEADLAAYNQFLQGESEATYKALQQEFDVYLNKTFESQQEFDAFFDELFRNVTTGNNQTVNEAMAYMDEQYRKYANDYQVMGDQIVYTYTSTEAHTLANADAVNKYGQEIIDLARAANLNDEKHKALIETYSKYRNSVNLLEQREKQYNRTRDRVNKQLDESAKTTANATKATDAYAEAIKKVDKAEKAQLNTLKQMYANGLMDKATYEAQKAVVEEDYLKQRMATVEKYGKDTDTFMSQLLDRQIARMEKAKAMLKEEADEMARYYEGLRAEDEGRLGASTGSASNGIADQEAYDRFQEKILAKAADIRAAITEDSARTEYETEVKWAEKLAEQKKITAEEAEKYILQAKLKYAQAAAQQVSQITETASNFVNSLKEYETQKAEAEYQAQLTAAGDNAEQREQVEADYEQKKLDIQKKYADTEMVINIAKTVANGAAAVKAFMEGGPFAGPALAALVAATTAAEVATIIAQRNAIRNTSVGGGSSSSSSSVATGQRTMTGYSEGGFTPKAASDQTAVGVVHANEYVAPAWMVRQNPVTFANLERYRKSGSHGRSGSMSRGFADGGFTPGNGGGISTSMPAQIDIEAAVEAAIRRVMDDGAIRAYVVRKDIEELDAQTLKFKKLGSR